jgi:hypothetical protein
MSHREPRRSCFLRADALASASDRLGLVILTVAEVLSMQSIAASQASPPPESSPIPQMSPQTAPRPSPGAAPSAEELQRLAKEAQNPVGNLGIVPFQNNWNYGVGPYDRMAYNLNLQPVIPIYLTKDLNLIERTIIPVINSPSNLPPEICASAVGCGSTFGIGDINMQLYFAPRTKPDKLIWGVGPDFTFPTASPGSLGAGKYLGGIDGVGLVMPGPWVIGMLVAQQWSFAGQRSRTDVSSFLASRSSTTSSRAAGP